MRATIILLLGAAIGCSDGSELSRQATIAEVRALDAEEKADVLAVEVGQISTDIKAIREELLLIRSRLAAQEKRLAEAPLPGTPPAVSQEQRELEYLEEQFGRLSDNQQLLARNAAEGLTRGTGTRQDAILLENLIGSNKLSDAFYEKNSEDLGAIREAIE